MIKECKCGVSHRPTEASLKKRDYSCKLCRSKRHRRYYLQNREKLIVRAKKYRGKGAVERYRKKNPDKTRAGNLLRDAVRTGKVKKLPCCLCGDKSSQGHHRDYTKPLDVVWLCAKHHKEAHIFEALWEAKNE